MLDSSLVTALEGKETSLLSRRISSDEESRESTVPELSRTTQKPAGEQTSPRRVLRRASSLDHDLASIIAIEKKASHPG